MPTEERIVMSDANKGSVVHFKKAFCCSFEPLPDITAYELAKIVPMFILCVKGIDIEEIWQKLGTAQRHCPRTEDRFFSGL